LLAIHATRYLATRQKDRSSDELLNWMKHAVNHGDVLPMVPDYAIDMHTARGQAMGRNVRHFLEEGARVIPELEGRELKYRELLLLLLRP
jgi:hypothetical protein